MIRIENPEIPGRSSKDVFLNKLFHRLHDVIDEQVKSTPGDSCVYSYVPMYLEDDEEIVFNLNFVVKRRK
jgi:hypothetical protein